MKDKILIIGCDDAYTSSIKSLLEAKLGDVEVVTKIYSYDTAKKISDGEETLKDKYIQNFKKFKDLIETTKTAYVIMSTDGVIKEVNKSFTEIVGCKNLKLFNINICDLLSKEDTIKIQKSLALLDKGIPIEDLEICIGDAICSKTPTCIHYNDNIVCCKRGAWIRINANVMENGEKNVFCLIKDITTKKIEEFEKYIMGQKQKDRVRQNISRIRDKIQNMHVQNEQQEVITHD